MKPQNKIFLIINKNDNGDGRGQSSWFSNGLRKKIKLNEGSLTGKTFIIRQTNKVSIHELTVRILKAYKLR